MKTVDFGVKPRGAGKAVSRVSLSQRMFTVVCFKGGQELSYAAKDS